MVGFAAWLRLVLLCPNRPHMLSSPLSFATSPTNHTVGACALLIRQVGPESPRRGIFSETGLPSLMILGNRRHEKAGAVRPRPQCSRGYAVDLGFLIQLVKGLKGSLKIRLHSRYLERNYRSGPRRKDHLYQT